MIGPGTTVRGNLSGDEDLTVEGRIEGTVRLSKNLEVAPGGTLEADVEARTVTIGGRITGNVAAADLLSVDAGAVMVGDVRTPRLIIADGAHFRGRVDMDFDVPGAEPQPKAPAGRRR